MPVRKTLLLSPTPPGEGSVGEHFLRRFVQCFPHDSIVCFSAWSKHYAIPVASPELHWLTMRLQNLPDEEFASNYRSSFWEDFKLSKARKKYRQELANLAESAVSFGHEHKVQVVLAVLASPSIIAIARRVADQLNAELVPLIWDPIQSTMRHIKFDAISASETLQELESIFAHSSRCGVASESMAKTLQAQYQLECSVMIRPVELKQLAKQKQINSSNRFVVGFSGTGYAQQEMAALVRAFDELDWKLGEKEIVLRLMGNYISPPLSAPGKRAMIEFLGYRPLPEALEYISGSDIAYLPYWFDEQFKQSVQQCFPDKLGTYITAGAPIFFHGPAESTPAQFMEKYPVGRCCHSLESKKIIEVLHEISECDEANSEKIKAAQMKAIKEVLHPERFLERIGHLLGAEPSALNKYWLHE